MAEHGVPRTVVVLRHPSRAVRIADALGAERMTVYALPLTEAERPPDAEAVRRLLAALARGEYRWLVITSGNTVRALEFMARGTDSGLAGIIASGRTRVAAVGAATARLLADAGVDVDLVPDDASAAGLVEAFARGSDRIALPQADLAPEDLRTGLTGLGWTVDRVEAYRTVPYPADPARRLPGVVEDGSPPPLVSTDDVVALGGAGVQPAVLFTAPSTVEQFRARLVGRPLAFHPVAIGRTTAAALRSLGWEPVATASGPTPGPITTAVRHAFGNPAVILRPAPAGSAPDPVPTPAPTPAPSIGDQP